MLCLCISFERGAEEPGRSPSAASSRVCVALGLRLGVGLGGPCWRHRSRARERPPRRLRGLSCSSATADPATGFFFFGWKHEPQSVVLGQPLRKGSNSLDFMQFAKENAPPRNAEAPAVPRAHTSAVCSTSTSYQLSSSQPLRAPFMQLQSAPQSALGVFIDEDFENRAPSCAPGSSATFLKPTDKLRSSTGARAHNESTRGPQSVPGTSTEVPHANERRAYDERLLRHHNEEYCFEEARVLSMRLRAESQQTVPSSSRSAPPSKPTLAPASALAPARPQPQAGDGLPFGVENTPIGSECSKAEIATPSSSKPLRPWFGTLTSPSESPAPYSSYGPSPTINSKEAMLEVRPIPGRDVAAPRA